MLNGVKKCQLITFQALVYTICIILLTSSLDLKRIINTADELVLSNQIQVNDFMDFNMIFQ